MARLVSLIVLATVIVLLGITFYRVVAPFLMPLFLAGVLALLAQPFYRRCQLWTKGRMRVAAGLTTAFVLTLFLLLSLVTVAAARQLYTLATTTLQRSTWTDVADALRDSPTFLNLVGHYEKLTGETVSVDELEQEIQTRLKSTATSLASKTLSFSGAATLNLLGELASAIVGLMTFVIALYYFLADGPALLAATERMIPVHRDYKRQLLVQFEQAVRAVVSATFAAAIGQGIATGIGMQFVGSGHFFLVTILATLTALVPLLGTWLIWGPYAVWLAIHGSWGAAIFLTLYGALFVGLLDNVIRTYVLHSNVKLHPLLAFVSVLGGLEVMGLWGVFIGPIVASCLHALVKIFNTELLAFSQERQARARDARDVTDELTEVLAQPPLGKAGGEPARATSSPPVSPAPAPPVNSPPVVAGQPPRPPPQKQAAPQRHS